MQKLSNMSALMTVAWQGLARKTLCETCQRLTQVWMIRRDNSNRTSICRTNRYSYVRQYPTMLVLPDGATVTIRYKEPRRIIKLPVDLSTLSESERRYRLQQRKPKQKIVIEEDSDDDDFDVDRYSHLWKNK
ncbi:39S ribosomal protein L55, mitochondrial-like [Pomacea canaliculata]|uniref:39S ribosomal protein L55, mitochondrial-like n=1 Tax=Pomacea canaliculata TaxID=400727 RepID=UPI000D72EB8A|nr:39S ribosomal protein L55, mitochondrial-like [Pomacea canaliculata]